ncbi:TPA: ankyrin repeat domain-containing protein [Salmonella enterica]|nr:ankyrin repeat domain-containing protein [Salmonella enterica]
MNRMELLKITLDAICKEDIPTLSLLLEKNEELVHGTPYGEDNSYGYLDYIISKEYIRIVKLFIEYGADVNRLNPGPLFKTPLCGAAYVGNVEIVNLLLDNGALVDGRDLTAITPLMIAAGAGHLSIVKILIERGAQLHRLGYIQRFFPIDFAISNGHNDCVSYLRDCGGFSVSDEYDWRRALGYPVIAHVSRNGGPIYPVGFSRIIKNIDFQFRLASIRAKDDPLFLFSAGLSVNNNPVEIGIALPNQWPLLDCYIEKNSKLSFPIDFLAVLAEFICNGEKIEEGFYITRDSLGYENLGWPENVVALVAVDHKWNESVLDVEVTSKKDNVIKIFTFMPFTQELKSISSEVKIKKWCASKSKAKWSKFLLPLMY